MEQALAVGERVSIHAPGPDDEAAFLAAARASRELYEPWLTPPLDEETFRLYLLRLRKRDQFGFLAKRRSDGSLVGVVNVSNVVMRAFRSGYLSYYAFAETHGRGLMGEATALVIGHAFDNLNLHRLEANIQPGNQPSIELVKRLGFRLEGLSPDYLFIAGAWRDHERWAITEGMFTLGND